MISDPQIQLFSLIVFGLLMAASISGFVLKRRFVAQPQREVINNLVTRVNAWWVMIIVFFLALLTGGVGSVILFGLISLMALREFITLTPTRQGDHRTLFWAFFVAIPLQYYLVGTQQYGIAVMMIPVYATLLVAVRSAIAGNTAGYLERVAKIQWGLMICVYFVSYAPALLMLQLHGFEGQGAKLLCFLVCVVQGSDVLQYIFGKLLGRRQIAPLVSPSKTVEGFLCGMAGAVILGMALDFLTPFRPWQAAGMALLIALMGFCGGLVMSAIKRDRGVKDYGSTIPGHGGMMDRIDSLCFAAPVFFHVTRFFFS